jgi:hypothetical protein
MDAMPMPETPIHENARPVFPHYHIRLPRQTRVIQPITIPVFPQILTHHHLRFRILTVNGSHIGMTLLWGEFVGHFVFS